jgi:hypothetical protein
MVKSCGGVEIYFCTVYITFNGLIKLGEQMIYIFTPGGLCPGMRANEDKKK